MQTHILRLPQGYDPDSFITEFGVEAYEKLIKESIPGLKFLIQTQKNASPSSAPEEKTKIVRNIANELGKIPDPIVRDDYIKQASEHLDVDEIKFRSVIAKKKEDSPEKEKIGFLPTEEILLLILFKHKTLSPQVLQDLNLEYMKDLKSEPIFRMIMEQFGKNKQIPELSEIKNHLDKSLGSALSKVLIESDYNPSVEEARDCLDNLKERHLEIKRRELQAQIKRLQRNKEDEKIEPLLKKIIEITNQLSAMPQRHS